MKSLEFKGFTVSMILLELTKILNDYNQVDFFSLNNRSSRNILTSIKRIFQIKQDTN